jgi:hypothetical protein
MGPLLLVLLAQAGGDAPLEPVDAGVAMLELATDAGVASEEEADAPPVPWWEGDHLTGEWGGVREWLSNHGVTIDFVYAGEVFADASHSTPGENGGYNGHFDLAVTVDTEDLGLWPGGKFYVLGQNNHGNGINEYVGSVTEISNIESRPYFQLGEFFVEQALFGWLKFRLGKQDSNRDFGTPRFGGNFINNNFGMLPSSPLPSYPTNGLGAVVVIQPAWWGSFKAAIFEGRPQISSFGFDSAFAPNAGHFLIASLNGTHQPRARHEGVDQHPARRDADRPPLRVGGGERQAFQTQSRCRGLPGPDSRSQTVGRQRHAPWRHQGRRRLAATLPRPVRSSGDAQTGARLRVRQGAHPRQEEDCHRSRTQAGRRHASHPPHPDAVPPLPS